MSKPRVRELKREREERKRERDSYRNTSCLRIRCQNRIKSCAFRRRPVTFLRGAVRARNTVQRSSAVIEYTHTHTRANIHAHTLTDTTYTRTRDHTCCRCPRRSNSKNHYAFGPAVIFVYTIYCHVDRGFIFLFIYFFSIYLLYLPMSNTHVYEPLVYVHT